MRLASGRERVAAVCACLALTAGGLLFAQQKTETFCAARQECQDRRAA